MRLFVHLRLCLQNIIHTVCHQDVLICQRRCGHSFGSWKEFINDFQKNFPRLTFTSEEWTHLFFFKYLVNNIFNITVGAYHHHCPELPLFLKKPFSYTPNTLAAAIVLSSFL